jgi:methylated-DNA-[protein]-cysteine S-methyltransferase/AraC family transcriptional regulator of adaptative response/methylated-DNA-[protein]-cysteine methyltransferase
MNLIDTETSSAPFAPAKSPNAVIPRDIIFSIGESALGHVLVARTADGVCAILIGSDAEELENNLAMRFPGSRRIWNKVRVREDLVKVLRFIERPAEGLDLTLDIRGTPFQRRVWEALRAIPVGTTVTYTELARRIGDPKAARAVASACAANTIALGIPCHRVVRSDGAVSGYRWGAERKRALINKEAMS